MEPFQGDWFPLGFPARDRSPQFALRRQSGHRHVVVHHRRLECGFGPRLQQRKGRPPASPARPAVTNLGLVLAPDWPISQLSPSPGERMTPMPTVSVAKWRPAMTAQDTTPECSAAPWDEMLTNATWQESIRQSNVHDLCQQDALTACFVGLWTCLRRPWQLHWPRGRPLPCHTPGNATAAATADATRHRRGPQRCTAGGQPARARPRGRTEREMRNAQVMSIAKPRAGSWPGGRHAGGR